MDRYVDRCIDKVIRHNLDIFGAVLIQGPKWCGKTTTAKRFARSSLSLSDPTGNFAALQLAQIDPAQAIAGPSPRLIDEWQEEPKLWDAVRFECDARQGESGQFILTGSATPRDSKQPMHSGVGRIARLRMDTMTLFELGVSSGLVTIGALLSAIGIAGMSRLNRANVLAMSGRAVEAAGDVDVLLLDKTGTITLGNRQAAEFIPVDGASERELADAAQLASLTDETPEGRSIVVLAKERFGIRARELAGAGMASIPFTAQTRMSGVDFEGHEIRKGAADAVKDYVESCGGVYSDECAGVVERVSRAGGTPLIVARDHRILGIVHLKDIVKQGIRENFADLRTMGIKTVMITGDNPMTAAAIAAEAGVDDFMAEATPESKLAAIRRYQAEGHLVAMTGDGTNDAPALAQADVAVAMNSGTQAAKEAGNMVDLDSSPTKLIDIVRIGKQLLMTRGSLTTFSIANDLAKYFAIVPALFVPLYPQLEALNIMHLTSPATAILAAVVYNAVVIVALIPLALRGVKYREATSQSLLARNLLVYGLGGIVLPFVAIKLLDMGLTALGVA